MVHSMKRLCNAGAWKNAEFCALGPRSSLRKDDSPPPTITNVWLRSAGVGESSLLVRNIGPRGGV